LAGFPVPPSYVQEVDGCLGVASLARSLSLGIKAKPLIFIEDIDTSLKIQKATTKGIGMKVVTGKQLKAAKSGDLTAGQEGYTLDAGKSESFARKLIDEYEPKAIIAVEKSGRNFKHVYHNMAGLDISKYVAKVEPLFEIADDSDDIVTIGIVDGGNEVGNGSQYEAILKHVPHAQVCRCPCKGGVAAECATDVLVRAAQSNWGAIGVAAILAYFAKDPSVFQSVDQGEAMLRACVDGGAAITGKEPGLPIYESDGRPIPVMRAVDTLLHRFISHTIQQNFPPLPY
jgi:hypothetical protein